MKLLIIENMNNEKARSFFFLFTIIKIIRNITAKVTHALTLILDHKGTRKYVMK